MRFWIRCNIVINIPACQAEEPSLIPGRGEMQWGDNMHTYMQLQNITISHGSFDTYIYIEEFAKPHAFAVVPGIVN